jgi:Uma2 family endonuclease
MPPGGGVVGTVATNIIFLVKLFLRDHPMGICDGPDTGFRLSSNPDTVRAPDVSFIDARHVPPDGVPVGYWSVAPDLAVEVLSPSNRLSAILRKVQEYLDAGTRLVWVIDPLKRRATVFRADDLPLTVGSDGELSGEDVLPGFVLRLTEIWV